MEKHMPETHLRHDYLASHDSDDAIAAATLEGTAAKDQSLEQVREILFGAESRRSEMERRALEARVAERFARIEAEYERRFEKLLQDLHQRFEKSCTMLEAEAAERRESMKIQHDELMERVEHAAAALGQAKTDREELAGLLNEVASRLRASTAAS
jgi:chromosome segregation ATPase